MIGKGFAKKLGKAIAKKAVHATLLRFPGGDPQSSVACVYCPELCRFSCPTAVVSGSDAVTPRNKMSLPYKEIHWPGRLTAGGAELWPLYDCTGCGRCTEYCVYEMPVADRLLAARETFSWKRATEIASQLDEGSDPWGDLAEELGDPVQAKRRRQALGAITSVSEPKACHSLRQAGSPVEWSGHERMRQDPARWITRLKGKRWLIHESVWASRRLGLHEEIRTWVKKLQAAGAQMAWAFHQGRDCIDCGGEGAYRQLFPEQAARMASDLWQRDGERADGILCFSNRCAEHLRSTLGPGVPVVSLLEIDQ